MIESPYLCIQPSNGPNELFMGTLLKKKMCGGEEGESWATQSAVYVWRCPQDIELHLLLSTLSSYYNHFDDNNIKGLTFLAALAE